jgi:branched-chain amino acid transport system substrate-binding protein
MQKLVFSDKVVAVLNQGPSAVQLATMPIAEQAQVVQLAVASSHKNVTGSGNKWVFRLNGTDKMFGGAVVDYMVKELGLKRFAILHLSDEFGYGAREEYESRLALYGLEPVSVDVMSTGDKDLRSQLMNARRANADALLLAVSYHDGAIIARQAKQLRLDVVIAGLAAFSNPKLIELGGNDVIGVLHGTPFFPQPDVPHMAEFMKRIEARGYPADVYSAQGYDGMMLLAEAIRNKGADPDSIRLGLMEIKDFQGVSAPESFYVAPNGEFIRETMVVRVNEDLKYEVVYRSRVE